MEDSRSRRIPRVDGNAADVGALRELVDVIRRSFPLKSLILTGGDAPFFAAELPEFTVADADFTFYGILLAAGNR